MLRYKRRWGHEFLPCVLTKAQMEVVCCGRHFAWAKLALFTWLFTPEASIIITITIIIIIIISIIVLRVGEVSPSSPGSSRPRRATRARASPSRRGWGRRAGRSSCLAKCTCKKGWIRIYKLIMRGPLTGGPSRTLREELMSSVDYVVWIDGDALVLYSIT